MGIFAEAQRLYAEHGIATFPVGPDKRPAIRNYLKIGSKGSARLAGRYGNFDAFGIRLNRNTVADVDSPDERLLADVLDRHGPTPLIVRTASRGFHCFYRNGGERRHTRAWPDRPVDILGDGFVVGPPSRIAKGRYEIIQGGLDDLDRLPRMRGVDDLLRDDTTAPTASAATAPATPEQIAKGARNEALFRFGMGEARTCVSFDDLFERGLAFAKTVLSPLPEPVPEAEVKRTMQSAWQYEKPERAVMGIFTELQPIYAAHGVPDLPGSRRQAARRAPRAQREAGADRHKSGAGQRSPHQRGSGRADQSGRQNQPSRVSFDADDQAADPPHVHLPLSAPSIARRTGRQIVKDEHGGYRDSGES
jgi:hypothetical protein